MPLAINNNMLGFSDWLLSLLCLSFSFFPFSSQNPFFFPQFTKPVSENPSHCSLLISRRNPKLSRKNYDPGFVNRWIFMNFVYAVRNSIAHTFTVAICDILFVEGAKGIAQRQYKWRFQSLLRLSDVWKFYCSSRRNNWRNLREPLEMLLSLTKDTWVRSEVRDELFTIGD